MPGRFTIILFILNLCVFNVAFSQNVQSTIAEMNTMLNPEYEFSAKGKTLLVKGFREGKQLKEEQVNVFDLDIESLFYSEADGTVAVKCYSDLDGCVEQKLLLDKKKTYRIRFVIAVPSEMGTTVADTMRKLLSEMTNAR